MFSSAHHQEWRKHPLLQRSNNVRKMLPGFVPAVAIFTAYVFAEAVYKQVATNPQTNDQHSTAAASTSPSVSAAATSGSH